MAEEEMVTNHDAVHKRCEIGPFTDPANLAVYQTTGALFPLRERWLSLVSMPFTEDSNQCASPDPL
jgi:hypothetical protein